MQAMKPADLNRFLVVCALVSNLYCPGYNPRQSFEKNSNFARTAVRYKIDLPKVSAAARAELTRKKEATVVAKKISPSAQLRRREPSTTKTTK